MRYGGRANTTSVVEEASDTMRVEMSLDDWEKWRQFKGMRIEEKQSTEVSNASTSAASANFGGKTSRAMSYQNVDTHG